MFLLPAQKSCFFNSFDWVVYNIDSSNFPNIKTQKPLINIELQIPTVIYLIDGWKMVVHGPPGDDKLEVGNQLQLTKNKSAVPNLKNINIPSLSLTK